ncbi:MAG TPA: hypothetical protein VMD02_04045 [Candidatus Omnitrophota bacterium]|nr:hypothetical protein [Candidatus Omnitrophota bacterium]
MSEQDDLEQKRLQHKLLEPMTIIYGQVNILLDGLAGELNDNQKARLTKIKELSEKLTNNIREHLKM